MYKQNYSVTKYSHKQNNPPRLLINPRIFEVPRQYNFPLSAYANIKPIKNKKRPDLLLIPEYNASRTPHFRFYGIRQRFN